MRRSVNRDTASVKPCAAHHPAPDGTLELRVSGGNASAHGVFLDLLGTVAAG
ncbi:hypothetical protein [Elioraea rosea]|uniref:hypothetical protein n=1 Tax=Elioraea rosea TaxID=2492390 RepID=UPI0013153586|nr:hypothetical protein [Elioraea rosea]